MGQSLEDHRKDESLQEQDHTQQVNASTGEQTSVGHIICVLGGILFGLGALANGACAFGSIARLAGGDLSYLAMPPAFLLGAILCRDHWQPVPLSVAMSPVWPAALATLATIALASFVVWRVFTAVKGARRRGVVRILSQPGPV